jgi:arylformamidase
MAARWIWLSHALSDAMPTYGDGEKPAFLPLKAMARGDSCNTARWTLPNHSGTHVDAPRHFFPDGPTISDYPAEFWVFRHSWCAAIPQPDGGGLIGQEQLPWCEIPQQTDLLLLKTGFGSQYGAERYWRDNPGLAPELAARLRSECPALRAVGFDFISVSSWRHRDAGREAHRAFLDPAGPPLLLVEDMNLSGLQPGSTFNRVIVAPLRVGHADASPCTVLAEVNE